MAALKRSFTGQTVRSLPAPRGGVAPSDKSVPIGEAVALFCRGAATPASRRSYQAALAVLEAMCSDHGVTLCSELTPRVVATLPGYFNALAPSTRRHRLSVARNFLTWAPGAGWVDPACAGLLRPGRSLTSAREAAWSLCEVEKVLAVGKT